MKRVLIPLLIVAALVAALWLVAEVPVRQARAAWRAGHDAETIAIAQRYLPWHVRTTEYHQLLAASYLTSRNHAAAAPHLLAIHDARIWFPAVPKEEVARRLFAIGDFDGFLAYDAATHEPRDRAEVLLYRAAALLSSNRTNEAGAAFRSIDPKQVNAAHYAALNRALANRARGVVPWLFDRAGGSMAQYDVANDRIIATEPAFAGIVGTFAAHAKELSTNTTIETTLDPVVQNAAVEALHGYQGALVAIDPRTNELLAIALTPGVTMESEYEPGSVIKILTGLNAIESGVNVPFPYDCKGFLEIDGRRFGDWVPAGHGNLASFDEAFAVSCNVVFADLGLHLGLERLHAFMTAAGFNGQTDLGVFKVRLGRTIEPIFNRFETAFFAIGLQHETITPLHLAMIASMVANHGVLTAPRLVRSRHSILSDLAAVPPPQPTARLATAASADEMIRAMQGVVTNPRGTGRRAEVAAVTLALKTGTSGSAHDHVLDALIAGFAPAQSPKIAFAVIGVRAGPAEYAGAKIAHDFVTALQARGLL